MLYRNWVLSALCIDCCSILKVNVLQSVFFLITRHSIWLLAVNFWYLCGLPFSSVVKYSTWVSQFALYLLLFSSSSFLILPELVILQLSCRLWEGTSRDHRISINNPVECQLRHSLQGHGYPGSAGKQQSVVVGAALCSYNHSYLHI